MYFFHVFYRKKTAFLCLMFNIIFPSLFKSKSVLAAPCPMECDCQGKIITCSERGLFRVPKDLPKNAERINLRGNNLTQISKMDFSGLVKLKKLELQDNRIYFIDERAFSDLSLLQFLSLEQNKISCIAEGTFRPLTNLKILTLNNNNITHLSPNTLNNLNALRTLRLYGNPIHCDCHLSGLTRWLSRRSNMAVLTQCRSPQHLRGLSLSLVAAFDDVCDESSNPPSCGQLACPTSCSCDDNIVDCRERHLNKIPVYFPFDIEEVQLEGNLIQEIPVMVFTPYTNLKRIDLSNNRIETIGRNAFDGLNNLTTLVLYGNNISSIPRNIFRDLSNLRLLFLNANQIRCLHVDTFESLNQLSVLSLYDNHLESLPKNILIPLTSIEILHLGKNPFVCDCNVKWLAKYLRKRQVEASGVRCSSPKRLVGKRIKEISGKRFLCQSAEKYTRHHGEDCTEMQCPKNCRCVGSTVDCSGLSLTSIPENIPSNAAELILRDNRIEVLKSTNAYAYLRNLKRIDLSLNHISSIDEGAFDGANSVVELLLNNNSIAALQESAFSGLDNLKTLMLRNNDLTCIGNNTFLGLKRLSHLSLFSNRIYTIVVGAFDSMTSLITLNLLSNPLNCNCHISWLSTWLRRSSVSAGIPRCFGPRLLKGLPVGDINPRDFRCDSEEIDQLPPTCTPAQTCPISCDCEGLVVRCGNRNLESIPVREILGDVTELYLDTNTIQEIPESLSRFQDLTTLDLSNNKITTLRDGMFSNLTKLSTLLLSYNRIQCVTPLSFFGLDHLRILNLHSNNLSSLPEAVFGGLNSLLNVGLGANPWYCDCHLRWFGGWVMLGNFEAGIARCAEPASMAGRLLLSVSPDDYVCVGPQDVAVSSKCNACLSEPCLHGSTCVSQISGSYRCNCSPGYFGNNCEKARDPCLQNPCLNKGLCQTTETLSYSCVCIPGFTGVNCEADIDDCASRPCQAANATCIDGTNQFSCRCPVGWKGDQCNLREANPCLLERDPCLNGGRCLLEPSIDENSYRCECVGGYIGINCSEFNDACANHKCENDAQCLAAPSSPVGYQCICRGNFRGPYCNLSPKSPNEVIVLRDDPCLQHDCQNGAKCLISQGQAGYQCRCMAGYIGERCEKLATISFLRNGSFVRVSPSFGGTRDINITIILATKALNGIIFYNGDSRITREHLAIELYMGHVRVSYDLGNYPGSKLYSELPINDGLPHKIQILIGNGVISLQIDSNLVVEHRTGTESGNTFHLTPPAFLGGMSIDSLVAARTLWHIRNGTSLKGCLHGVFINGTEISFSNFFPRHDGSIQSVVPGCGESTPPLSCSELSCVRGNCVTINGIASCACEDGYEGERCEEKRLTPPCQYHSCQHGTCLENGTSFNCDCASGFTGKYCHLADNCFGVDCGKGSCINTGDGYKCKCFQNAHLKKGRCAFRVRPCTGKRARKYYRVSYSKPNRNRTECRSKRKHVSLVCNTFSCSSKSSTHKMVFGVETPRQELCCQPVRVTTKRVPIRCPDGKRFYALLRRVRRCGCIPCKRNS